MTAILANGIFPREGGRARELLLGASRIVACDGAADTLLAETGRVADLVVGDFDSLKGRYPHTVLVTEQDTSDLAKAHAECLLRGWDKDGLLLFGATGLREDHAIANVFRALDLGLEIISDFGRFLPVISEASISAAPGSAVSIFAPHHDTIIKSIGLQWPLDGVRLDNLYCASLNRATLNPFSLTTTKPVMVYVENR